jgi:hypothetical protein
MEGSYRYLAAKRGHGGEEVVQLSQLSSVDGEDRVGSIGEGRAVHADDAVAAAVDLSNNVVQGLGSGDAIAIARVASRGSGGQAVEGVGPLGVAGKASAEGRKDTIASVGQGEQGSVAVRVERRNEDVGDDSVGQVSLDGSGALKENSLLLGLRELGELFEVVAVASKVELSGVAGGAWCYNKNKYRTLAAVRELPFR